MSRDKVRQFRGTIYEQGKADVANAVLRDERLTVEARMIYSFLNSYANESSFPGMHYMAANMGKNMNTIREHRDFLEAYGYITIKQEREEGAIFSHNVYEIELTPKERPELIEKIAARIEKHKKKVASQKKKLEAYLANKEQAEGIKLIKNNPHPEKLNTDQNEFSPHPEKLNTDENSDKSTFSPYPVFLGARKTEYKINNDNNDLNNDKISKEEPKEKTDSILFPDTPLKLKMTLRKLNDNKKAEEVWNRTFLAYKQSDLFQVMKEEFLQVVLKQEREILEEVDAIYNHAIQKGKDIGSLEAYIFTSAKKLFNEIAAIITGEPKPAYKPAARKATREEPVPEWLKEQQNGQAAAEDHGQDESFQKQVAELQAKLKRKYNQK